MFYGCTQRQPNKVEGCLYNKWTSALQAGHCTACLVVSRHASSALSRVQLELVTSCSGSPNTHAAACMLACIGICTWCMRDIMHAHCIRVIAADTSCSPYMQDILSTLPSPHQYAKNMLEARVVHLVATDQFPKLPGKQSTGLPQGQQRNCFTSTMYVI
jgi:hypothetical protein